MDIDNYPEEDAHVESKVNNNNGNSSGANNITHGNSDDESVVAVGNDAFDVSPSLTSVDHISLSKQMKKDDRTITTISGVSASASIDISDGNDAEQESALEASASSTFNNVPMHLEKYESMLKKLIDQCRAQIAKHFEEDIPVDKIPNDLLESWKTYLVSFLNVSGESNSIPTFPDEHISLLSCIVEGSTEPLKQLVKRALSILVTEELSDSKHLLLVTMVEEKIKLIAKRVSFGIKPTKIKATFEDMHQDALWRWEVDKVELLPDSIKSAMKKTRPPLKNLKSWISAVDGLLSLLRKHSGASVVQGTDATKILEAIEKVIKFERETEVRRLKELKQAEEIRLKETKKAEALKAKAEKAALTEEKKSKSKKSKDGAVDKEASDVAKSANATSISSDGSATNDAAGSSALASENKESAEGATSTPSKGSGATASAKKAKTTPAKEIKGLRTLFSFGVVKAQAVTPTKGDVVTTTISAEHSTPSQNADKEIDASSSATVAATVISTTGLSTTQHQTTPYKTAENVSSSATMNRIDLNEEMDKKLASSKGISVDDIFNEIKTKALKHIETLKSKTEIATMKSAVTSQNENSISAAANSLPLEIDDVSETGAAVREAQKRKKKLFQFSENLRPAYFGTWKTVGKHVDGRCPLNREEEIDYNVDSDDEWEEPDDGESLSDFSNEDKEDAENRSELDYKDGWLMEDDVVELASNADDDDDEDEVGDPNQKTEEGEKKKNKKKKVFGSTIAIGRPTVAVINSIDESKECLEFLFLTKNGVGTASELLGLNSEENVSSEFRPQKREGTSIITIEFPTLSENLAKILPLSIFDIKIDVLDQAELAERAQKAHDASNAGSGNSADSSTNSKNASQDGNASDANASAKKNKTPKEKKPGDTTQVQQKRLVNDEHYPALLKFVEGNTSNIEDLVDNALLLEELKVNAPSKKQLYKAIIKIAKKEKREGDLSKRWYVEDEMLEKHQVARIPPRPKDPVVEKPKKAKKSTTKPENANGEPSGTSTDGKVVKEGETKPKKQRKRDRSVENSAATGGDNNDAAGNNPEKKKKRSKKLAANKEKESSNNDKDVQLSEVEVVETPLKNVESKCGTPDFEESKTS